MEAEPRLLKMSEVRTLTGIPMDALQLFISDGLLPGVVRGSGGHQYLRADRLPTIDQVQAVLEEQLAKHLQNAAKQVDRVEVEVEAVRNDITMAIEDPHEDLGHDLLTLRARSSDPRSSSLTSALGRLEQLSWEVRSYHDVIRELRRTL